jgi:metal-responsive CopG/Arc/MetJ family transcriptional regulator
MLMDTPFISGRKMSQASDMDEITVTLRPAFLAEVDEVRAIKRCSRPAIVLSALAQYIKQFKAEEATHGQQSDRRVLQ